MSDVMIAQKGRDIMSSVIEQVVLARSLQHRSLQESVTPVSQYYPIPFPKQCLCVEMLFQDMPPRTPV